MKRKDSKISFRVTDDEEKKLSKFLKKTHLSRSEFMRLCMIEKIENTKIEIENKGDWEQKETLIRTLNYIGNNINQVAKTYNTYKDISKVNLTEMQRDDIRIMKDLIKEWENIFLKLYDC